MSKGVIERGIPRRGNWFTRQIGNGILRWMGWRLAGDLPDLPKIVAIVAPHTSNWDWILGMGAMFSWGVRIAWLGKDSLFRGILNRPMRWLGGVPVDRSAAQGTVVQIIDEFRRRDQLVLVISPEGTRKKVSRWKTGFYHIAYGAGVPICPISLDYAQKIITLHPLFYPQGNAEEEIDQLREMFRHVPGKFPHH